MLPQTNKDDTVSVEGVRRSLGLLNSTLCFSISAAGLFGISISTSAGAVFRAVRAKTGERPVYREAAEALPMYWRHTVLTPTLRGNGDLSRARASCGYYTPVSVRLNNTVRGRRSRSSPSSRSPSLTRCTQPAIDADQTSPTVKVANMFLRGLWWTPGRWDCVGWLA